MGSEIRKRLPQLQPSKNIEQLAESSVASETELTPTSSEATEDTQVFPSLWDMIKLQNFFRNAKSATPSRSEDEKDAETVGLKDEYDEIRHEKVEDFPKGFPRFAAMVSSSDDLSMFRGFKRSHARILLHLEVQISELEKELDKLDKEDVANPAMRYRLTKTKPKHDENWDPKQYNLMEQLCQKLKEYDDFFLKNSLIQGHGTPLDRNYRSFCNWNYTKEELSPGYRDFIFQKDDFVCGVGATESNRRTERNNYFLELIRTFLVKWPNSPLKV